MTDKDLRPMTAWSQDGKFRGTTFIPGSQPDFDNTYQLKKDNVHINWPAAKPAIDLLRLYGWMEKAISEAFNISTMTLRKNHPREELICRTKN